VVETCVAKLLERFGDVARSVRATEHLQFAIVESLRAETGAIDSEAAQVAKEIASSAAVTGIDLQRQLRIFRNLKSIADSRQNSFDLIDRQKRRRAAAEVNRVDERGRLDFLPASDLRTQCPNISLSARTVVHSCRKIAVRTARAAERSVE